LYLECVFVDFITTLIERKENVMTEPMTPQNEQPINAAEEPMAAAPSQILSGQPVVPSNQGIQEEEASWYFEEEQPDPCTPFVAPFQISGVMPTMPAPTLSSDQASGTTPSPTAPVTPPKTSRKPRFSLMKGAILACVIVIVGLFVLNALAQTTPPLTMHEHGPLQKTQAKGASAQRSTENQQQVKAKPSLTPTPAHTTASSGQGQQGQTVGQASFDWVPQQLPSGWTNAGLQTGDAIEALRTAVAFNDREMSLDYRSVGTRNDHGGTFTAATFILTPAARQRFQQNDVREINNALFDRVVDTKLIRLVVDPQPQLVKFARQGQQQFAWIDVAFQFWQSQIDPNNSKLRTEGKDIDPSTHLPRIHHMMVLLLHISADDAGNNPPMGGTGWLVSNYGLDLPNGTPLDIVQPA
jgi:hypothetical protein